MVGGKRGQAAFEYILVVSMIGIMILPATYLLYSYSQNSGDKIDKTQLDRLGRDIASAAEKVYYQGPPSRVELEVRMPKGVTNISVLGDWGTGMQYLMIRAKTGEAGVEGEYPFRSSVNLNGSFNGSLGTVSISSGIKKVTIEAYQVAGPGGQVTSFSHINFGGRCPASSVYDYNADERYTGQDDGFFKDCYCGWGDTPNHRPSKTWQSGWFKNDGGYQQGSPSAACMNADYNGDCFVDDLDKLLYCAATGRPCNPLTCP